MASCSYRRTGFEAKASGPRPAIIGLHGRENVANTRSGKATVGGNPEARVKAHERMFEFLSAALSTPLSHTHAKRLAWHRYVVPPDRGFARMEELGAVPLGQNGRSRY